MSIRYILFIAAMLGAVSVALGAFGAHKLKELITPERLDVFHTAVKYHMIHVLAIFAAAFVYKNTGSSWALYAIYAMIMGIVFFSGSLYLLSTRTILGIEGWTWLGPITPLGGLAFIAGWVIMGVAALKGPW